MRCGQNQSIGPNQVTLTQREFWSFCVGWGRGKKEKRRKRGEMATKSRRQP
uniref:Uncharacterized protein n=1 Tax=Arundo donax TaxID=35708 RepID=A0A0A9B4U3_ARUDO